MRVVGSGECRLSPPLWLHCCQRCAFRACLRCVLLLLFITRHRSFQCLVVLSCRHDTAHDPALAVVCLTA